MREEIKNSSRKRIGYIEDGPYGKKIILDDKALKLGEIREEYGGKLAVYDRMLHRLGHWDNRNDVTYDKNGRRIGNGNLLLNFLFENL